MAVSDRTLSGRRLFPMRRALAQGGLGGKVIRAVVGSAGLSILGLLFTFILGVLLARALGVEGYGVYGLAMGIIAVLGVPSQLGIPQLLTREVAASVTTENWPLLKGILQWSISLVLLISCLISMLLVSWVILFGPGLDTSFGATLAVASLLIPLISLIATIGATLRGMMHVMTGQVPDIVIRPMLFALLMAAAFLASVPVTPVMAMGFGAIGALVALVVGIWQLARLFPVNAINHNASRLGRQWMSAAFPMGLSEGLRVMQGQAAIIVLGAVVSLSDVGLFRVASSIMMVVVFPLSVINLVTAPFISRLVVDRDFLRLHRLLAASALVMSISVILLTVPFIISGGWILQAVFGPEFRDANGLVLILAVGALANAALGLGSTFLNMSGRHARVTRATTISALILCGVLWPSVHWFGSHGAAVAVTCSTTLWSFLLWLDAKHLESLDISLMSTMTAFRN